MKKTVIVSALIQIALIVAALNGYPIIMPSGIITDTSINAGDTVLLAADSNYILSGMVWVESGAVVIIE
ncbi:MAG: hypothetical protein GF401_02635, partial [Chitinivibrionales bacterium]|nr:hypothetical protein [Chitinivibrionales bacterium]